VGDTGAAHPVGRDEERPTCLIGGGARGIGGARAAAARSLALCWRVVLPLQPAEALLKVVRVLLGLSRDRDAARLVEARHVCTERIEIAADDVGQQAATALGRRRVVQPVGRTVGAYPHRRIVPEVREQIAGHLAPQLRVEHDERQLER